MRLARPFPKSVNPLPSLHESSPQRRRDAEISAEKRQANENLRKCDIGLRLVHPSAARTALVGQASACQSGRSPDSFLQAVLFVALDSLVLSALISAPLRLRGENTFTEAR